MVVARSAVAVEMVAVVLLPEALFISIRTYLSQRCIIRPTRIEMCRHGFLVPAFVAYMWHPSSHLFFLILHSKVVIFQLWSGEVVGLSESSRALDIELY